MAKDNKALPNSKPFTEKKAWDEANMALVTDHKPVAPKLPIHVYSERWQECIRISAEVCGCSLDYAALPLMVAVASTLGNARRIQAWDGFDQPCILWGMLVGMPSTHKSPALDNVIKPLTKLEEELGFGYEAEVKAWKLIKEKADLHADAWKKRYKNAIDKGNPLPEKPADAEPSKCPIKLRSVVVDATMESARNILSGNPRGLLMIRDELSGFIENLGRYNGSDREFYLPAYDGGYYSADRVKNDDTIVVPSLSISMLGGIQPDKFQKCFKKTPDDGFTARFLMIEPTHVVRKRPDQKPDSAFIFQSLRKLRYLKMLEDDEGRVESIVIPLTEDAAEYFDKWRMQSEKRELDTTGMLTSFVGKTPGMVLRIALVLLYMDWIEADRSAEPSEVPKSVIERAITLVDTYFIPMAHRTLFDVAMPPEERNARFVAKYIMKRKPEVINLSKFCREAGSPVRDRGDAKAAFEYLVESGWLQYIGGRDCDYKGGKQRMDYAVNPTLYKK